MMSHCLVEVHCCFKQLRCFFIQCSIDFQILETTELSALKKVRVVSCMAASPKGSKDRILSPSTAGSCQEFFCSCFNWTPWRAPKKTCFEGVKLSRLVNKAYVKELSYSGLKEAGKGQKHMWPCDLCGHTHNEPAKKSRVKSTWCLVARKHDVHRVGFILTSILSGQRPRLSDAKEKTQEWTVPP